LKAWSDGTHGCIFMWLLRQCMEQRPGLSLYPGAGVKSEVDRRGRARVDGVLAPRGHFKGHGEWSDPDGILMAVEITARHPDTNRRRRVDKPIGYAEANIPVYLLIDRDDKTTTVYSKPGSGRYRQAVSHPWGATVVLPFPVDVTLSTEKLKDYAH
ncbi:Uma2 family endonuclease, partial [Streptomyces caeruleatus]